MCYSAGEHHTSALKRMESGTEGMEGFRSASNVPTARGKQIALALGLLDSDIVGEAKQWGLHRITLTFVKNQMRWSDDSHHVL